MSYLRQNIRQRYHLALPTVSSFICKVDIDIVSKRGSVTLLLLQLCDTDSQTKLEFNVNPVSFGCHSKRKSNTVGFSLWMKLAHMCSVYPKHCVKMLNHNMRGSGAQTNMLFSKKQTCEVQIDLSKMHQICSFAVSSVSKTQRVAFHLSTIRLNRHIIGNKYSCFM